MSDFANVTETVTYQNVFMGWISSLESGEGYTVIVPNLSRVTAKQRIRMVRELAQVSGRTIPDTATDELLIRESNRFAGRYAHVEIKYYDDGTYSYFTPTSGGGGHRTKNLTILP